MQVPPVLKKIIISISDFFFPAVCFFCGERLKENEEKICGLCWDEPAPVREEDETVQLLKERFKEAGIIDRFVSVFYFEHGGVYQKMAHALKYEGMTFVGRRLGELLGELLKQDEDICRADSIIPVPLHPLRRRERGYNQSEEIGRGLINKLDLKILPSAVRRVKNTVTQTHLDAEQRRCNVSDAFEVDPKYLPVIAGKDVVIIDDVMTTGATLEAIGAALKNAGVRRVYAATAGLAVYDSR